MYNDFKCLEIFTPSLSLHFQEQRFGVREHDKILTINGKTPRNVDDAVGVIKQVTGLSRSKL